MEPRWEKKISEFLEMILSFSGGDFQGIAGLSSDDSLLVGVNSARAKFYEDLRAVKHRLDESGQISLSTVASPHCRILFHLAAVILAENQGSLEATQNQASVIVHRGWKSSNSSSLPVLGRNIFLTFPFIDRDFTPADSAAGQERSFCLALPR